MYTLNKKQLSSFEKNNQKCYCLANGLGGYTSGSLINSFNRKHYGYLVASLKSPTQRYMLLARITERIGNTSLECTEYKEERIDNSQYIDSVAYDGAFVASYTVGKVQMKKSIAPIYGKNAVAIAYEFTSEEETKVTFTPYFTYRDHGDVLDTKKVRFTSEEKESCYNLYVDQQTISLSYSSGAIVKRKNIYSNPVYFQYDFETGDERYDTYYTPIDLEISLGVGTTKVGFVCSLDEMKKDAFMAIDEYNARVASLKKQSELKDPLALDLAWAADTFITERESTGLKTVLAGLPWFTDWGRDTMIAFTGLTLVTRRFDEAKEILKSFALYEKNGLIPNMFPEEGGQPMYNTVDASLWYFYACYKYIEYTGDKDFIIKEIYPTLKNIIHYYMVGTENNIHMDKDYLISCGDKDTQITWMDVKTNGIAVTPRFGKPVEIQALWYNALCIMDTLKEDTLDPKDYASIAKKVKESFNQKFFNTETGCLYDTVDPMDASIRPNQCFVLSLPFKVLVPIFNESVFDVITKDLYNILGLRSLSYRDPRFKPKYEGKLLDRDFAYHMGTTWGFLIGTYFDAYHYVYQNSPTVKEEIRGLVQLFVPHLQDGCINGIAEIFDGDIAKRTRGCYTQAWSVGELLRSYYENVLKEN